MSFQCKDLLIICQFSFRVVTLDLSLFDLFPFFMLEVFLKYLVASGCLYVRVKHFNRSWQKTEDVDRACTLMDWNLFFFFPWGPPGSVSTGGKCPASAGGGRSSKFQPELLCSPLLVSWCLMPTDPELFRVYLRIW